MEQDSQNQEQPEKQTRRRYSPEAKARAVALLAANSSMAAPLQVTADQLQIPDATLSQWSKGRNLGERAKQLIKEQKESLAELYDQVATLAAIRLRERLADDDAIEKTPLMALATTGAIAVDKLRALRGESTVVEHVSTADRIRAEELYRQAIEYFEGDKEKALALLREKAPTLAGLLRADAL